MGYDGVSITVYGRVSRHNSERDREDDARWNELKAEIERIVERYDLAGFDVWVG